jgi:hypothetical protein
VSATHSISEDGAWSVIVLNELASDYCWEAYIYGGAGIGAKAHRREPTAMEGGVVATP